VCAASFFLVGAVDFDALERETFCLLAYLLACLLKWEFEVTAVTDISFYVCR
jgi:hypothetical protein